MKNAKLSKQMSASAAIGAAADRLAQPCVQPSVVTTPALRHQRKRLPALGYFAAALLVVATTACGGKDKKANTTPTGGKPGAGSGQSMTDGDPVGGGTSAGGGANGGGNGPSDGGGNAGGGSASPGEPGAPPPILPPNLDPDPGQAKSAVEMHLQVARKALGQNSPDADTALREARLALGIDAANVDAAAMVALAYYHKRLYDTAELVLDDVFKRDAAKRNANVLYVYGLVYDKTNRATNAALAFRQAVEADPNHASALTNLGAYQLRNKQYDEAATTYDRLVQQFGRNDAITLTGLGSAYRGRAVNYPPGGQRDALTMRAEDAYKRAMTAAPSYGAAYFNLALLYLDTDPMPTSAGPMDTLVRLNQAKTYLETYRAQAGADIKLYDERMKDVSKAVKREEKRRKNAAKAANNG